MRSYLCQVWQNLGIDVRLGLVIYSDSKNIKVKPNFSYKKAECLNHHKNFKVSENSSVLLLLSYYFITVTMYIPVFIVYIDIHFFIKDSF